MLPPAPAPGKARPRPARLPQGRRRPLAHFVPVPSVAVLRRSLPPLVPCSEHERFLLRVRQPREKSSMCVHRQKRSTSAPAAPAQLKPGCPCKPQSMPYPQLPLRTSARSVPFSRSRSHSPRPRTQVSGVPNQPACLLVKVQQHAPCRLPTTPHTPRHQTAYGCACSASRAESLRSERAPPSTAKQGGGMKPSDSNADVTQLLEAWSSGAGAHQMVL